MFTRRTLLPTFTTLARQVKYNSCLMSTNISKTNKECKNKNEYGIHSIIFETVGLSFVMYVTVRGVVEIIKFY
jgi:hypothetical protein